MTKPREDQDRQSGDVVWAPTQGGIEQSSLYRFMQSLAKSGYGTFASFNELHRWAVKEPHSFWPELLRHVGIISEGNPGRLWDEGAGLTPLAKRWFPDLRINFAENLLVGGAEEPAIISWSEAQQRRQLSRGELKRMVSSVAGYLRSLGIHPEERVFGYLPNIPEAAVCMLGAAAIGATWSSCGTDYQVDGLLARSGRVRPKVLVAVSSYLWRGKVVDVLPTVREVLRHTPSCEHVILVDYLGDKSVGEALKDISTIKTVQTLSTVISQSVPITAFEKFPFSHPLYVMFSSGTTGTPKGLVHGAGGTLLEHKKEQMLHSDIRPGDVVFYQTSTSWMMWNWLVSGLASGATIVLYDGDPLIEEGAILWRMADTEGITHFGTSAAFLGALEKQGVRPTERFALAKLRAIFSTGSTLYPAQFDYVTSFIKPLWLQSISGGTDIIGCFGLGSPLNRVIRGEVQVKSLGYDVCVFNATGSRVVGEEGELVCANPVPSMPICFVDDPDGAAYRAAYFKEFSGVWRHGDFLEETSDGGLLFLGRSDATLKPAGVRVATADIYAALHKVSEITQALAVGYTPAGGTSEKVILYVVLASGITLTEALVGSIRETLRRSNAFYVPALIIHAPELPRTSNNKLSELSVKRILKGEDPGNAAALANPTALEFFKGEGLLKVKAAFG